MGSKTSRKTSLFLSMNLLCYVLAATTTSMNIECYNCSGPLAPGLTPPRDDDGGSGSGGSSSSSGRSSGTNPGQQPATCPRDALKLGVCANLLGGLMGVVVGNPPITPCYTLLLGLVDLEAAVCLCTVIRANVLGVNIKVPVALSLLLNVCGRTPPLGFTCA